MTIRRLFIRLGVLFLAIAAASCAKLTKTDEGVPPPDDQGEQRGAIPSPLERAVLYEEDSANPQGRSFSGSVTWRLEMSHQERGHSLGAIVWGDILIADRINAVLSLSRADPSTDRIEIAFKPIAAEEGKIGSVPGLVTKANEQAKPVPILANPALTRKNDFVLEFTNRGGHRQQNLRLLRDQSLLDVLLVYKDGRRASLSLSKGASGTRLINQALASWDTLE